MIDYQEVTKEGIISKLGNQPNGIVQSQRISNKANLNLKEVEKWTNLKNSLDYI